MRNLLIVICLIIHIPFQAQETYKVWDENPAFSTLLESNINENVIGILFNEKYEFYHTEEGDLHALHTFHKKFRLNNDESINSFNKISISTSNVIDILEIRARAIKPNGKVVHFDENSIKEVTDEDNGNSYKIFAIDGIEVGDDVEYYVVRKVHAGSFGRTFFQFGFPVQDVKFELISPKELLYDIKGYNGFPEAIHTVLEDERNSYVCEWKDVKSIKEEKFSYLTPRKARLEYRLDYNFNSSNSQKLTWDDAAQRVYSNMYLGIDDEDVSDWLEVIKISSASPLEQIKEIEIFVKNNVYIEEFNNDDLSNLKYILENKVSSAQGVVKLYSNLFKALNINHDLVLTVMRDEVKFDGDFQSWNYLDEYLIYFPDHDTYLEPEAINFRLGSVSGNLTATDGLFIERVQIGDFESAIGKIKYIKPSAYRDNYHNMIINMSINADEALTKVETTSGFKGLSGGYIGEIYPKLDQERQKSILADLKMGDLPVPDYTTLESIDKCEHDSLKDGEFIIHSLITTDAYLEEAGNKLLVNIGESIGQQAEMYFEEDRTADVENFFNRWYYREIIVEVPEGYKIMNPEVANMSVIEKVGSSNAFGFESAYTYENGVYKIIIDEYYKVIYVEPDNFEGFKQVVNAAADFNKLVLVLEKI